MINIIQYIARILYGMDTTLEINTPLEINTTRNYKFITKRVPNNVFKISLESEKEKYIQDMEKCKRDKENN
jgi:hypothetical protein